MTTDKRQVNPEEKMPLRVYTPRSALRSPLRLAAEIIRGLGEGRELAWRLTVRDISAQYRQSALGIAWAFAMPLANTLTWIFLNASGVVEVSRTDIPYPLYVFTGTMLWSIFMEALNAPMQKTQAAKSMLTKINFPRESLILGAIYHVLFNSAIKCLLMMLAVAASGIWPGPRILLFPLGVLALMLAGVACGLLITPIGILYRDIGNALPLLMSFFMYLTPVVFPLPQEGWAALIIRLNPMTPLILSTRDWLTGGDHGMALAFMAIAGLIAGAWILTMIVYRTTLPILIERMSA